MDQSGIIMFIPDVGLLVDLYRLHSTPKFICNDRTKPIRTGPGTGWSR